MRVAIEVCGNCNHGLWSNNRGEGRYCQNLGEALALAGHQVDCFGPSAGWGDCPPVPGLAFHDWWAPPDKERHYDAFFDSCWWPDKRHTFLPVADVYMHGFFSWHDACLDRAIAQPGHCIVYPYPMGEAQWFGDWNPYADKAFCVPFPFYRERMSAPHWDAPAVLWAAKVVPQNQRDIPQCPTAMRAILRLAKEFDLQVEFIQNAFVLDGREWYVPGQEVLEDKPFVRWHRPLLYGPFKELVSQRCKVEVHLGGPLTGAIFDVIVSGGLPTAMEGSVFQEPAERLGLVAKTADDFYPVFKQVLSDRGLFEEAVSSYQRVVEPLSYAGAVRGFEEAVRRTKAGA